MTENPLSPERTAFESRWRDALEEYMLRYADDPGGGDDLDELPEPSPWVGDLAAQLGPRLAPDYDASAHPDHGSVRPESPVVPRGKTGL